MLSRLVRQSGVYAIAGALLKAAGLLMAPILLNPGYLEVDDYGSYALLMTTAQLVVFVAGLGLSTAILRFLTRKEEGIEHENLPAAALALSLAASVVAALLFLVFGRPLAQGLTDDPGNAFLLGPLAVYVGAKCLAAIPLALLRVRERPAQYTIAVVLEMVVLVGLVYVELVVNRTGLAGLVRAYAVASVVALVVLLAQTVRTIRWRFDPKVIRPLLKFGVPMVLASLAGWFLNAGDRYLLKWLADREAVAAYEWSARLAGLINMLLIQSFQLAFTVVGLKAIGQGAEGFYRRTLRHFTIWTGAAVLMLSVWTPDLMRVLMRFFEVDAAYFQARHLVFPLALGFGAYGVYIIVNNALLASGRTGVIGANVAVVAVLNGVLNVALIPVFGAMGAAVSTTLSYAVLAAVAAWTSRNELAVSYPWRVPATVTITLTAIFFLALAADELDPGPRFLAKLGLCATYAASVPLLGLYSSEHIAAGWQKVLSVLRDRKL